MSSHATPAPIDLTRHDAANVLTLYWAGLVVIVSMVIGGGTTNGLLSDRIIQMMLVPLLLATVFRLTSTSVPIAVSAWIFCLFAVLIWQFIPVQGLDGSALQFVSASPGKALDYAVFAICLAGFALFVMTLDAIDQRRLLLFFVLGYFINLTMAAVQLSFVGGAAPFASPFYRLVQGAFANQNHFASLIYALIPVFALILVGERRQRLLYGLTVLSAIVVLLAADARAAITLSLILSLLSFFVFAGADQTPARRRNTYLLAGMTVAALAAMLAGSRYIGGFGDDMRSAMFPNTWAAIADHWPWGSGLGSFKDIYPPYELLTGIERTFANHAHNDYLELILELGLPGLVLIVWLIVMLVANLLRTRRTLACGLGALAIAAHSMVDYPLRTFAIGMLFAYLCAVTFSDTPDRRRRSG